MPSQIAGLVYCSGNLTTSSNPVQNTGVLVVGGSWSGGGSISLAYDSYYAGNPPHGFAHSDRVLEVVGADRRAGGHQAVCNQPVVEGVLVGQELGPVLEVDGVDERLDQPQLGARGLTFRHRALVYP